MDICVYVNVNKVIRCECVNTIIGGGGCWGARVQLDKLGGPLHVLKGWNNVVNNGAVNIAYQFEPEWDPDNISEEDRAEPVQARLWQEVPLESLEDRIAIHIWIDLFVHP